MAQHLMLAWYLCDFQGIWPSIANRPYILVIFQGGGGSGPPVIPLDPHTVNSFASIFCKFHFALSGGQNYL